ncbi:MAG: type II toxin-antitoxin system RelE/ParE family toxin [Bacteroidota bacterium]
MAKKIVWTKRANHKFNTIIDYLAVEWGAKVTQSFVIKTYDIIDIIAEHPELGTLENNQKNIRGLLITDITGSLIGLQIKK